MKAYQEYKETWLDWFEKVPKHWDLQRLNVNFDENKSLNTNLMEFNALQFKFGEIISKKTFERTKELENTYSKYTIVKKNDIIINGLNLNYDFVTQRVAIVSNIGIITSAYIALTPKKNINPQYYNLLLKTLDAKKILNGLGTGIRLTLDYNELKKIKLPIPPRNEQDQIVKFLDYKISKINKFIKNKKKLIELLNEQKQAVINHAVTKGLNPNVEMKDSVIDWLGEVPKHWEVSKLKRYCQINAPINHLIKNFPNDENLVFLPMEKVSTDGKIDCSEKRSFASVKSGFSSFAKNDVVIAKITPCFENGKGAYLDKLETEVGYGTTEFIVIRPNKKILGQYLYYITRSQQFRLQGEEKMTGSAGQKRISSDYVAQYTLGIPNITEQQEILDFILKSTDKLSLTISKTQKEIDLIQEYKTSLISSVVTGQVDVRDVIIPNFTEGNICDIEKTMEELEEGEIFEHNN